MKQANKYGTLRVVSRWLDLLPQTLVAWRVFVGYAAVLTLLSAILNRWSYTCSEIGTGFWCHWFSDNSALLFGTVALWGLVAFYLYCLFAHDFFENILNRQKFQLKDIFSLSKPRLKSVGIFLFCLLGIVIPCAILIYILNPMKLQMWHTANPDWRIELIFYTIAFICMAIPLLIMRCAGGIAYSFNEGQIPFRKIFDLTYNRAYVGIFSFLLLMLLCANLHLNLMRSLNKLAGNYHYLVTAVLTEFCNNFMILFYFSLFLLLFQAEYLVLKDKEADMEAQAEEEKTAREQIMAENEAKKVVAQSKKSAKKKKSQRKNKKLEGD